MKLGRKLTVAAAALCLVLFGALLIPHPAAAATLQEALPLLRHDALALSLLGALGGTLTVADLKKKRATLLDEMDSITRSELTDDSRKRFDAIEGELTGLEADIKRLERAEAAQRERAASQAPAVVPPAAAVLPTVAERRDLGWEFGAFVRAYADSQFTFRSQGRHVEPAAISKDLYGERHPVTEELQRAQVASDNASGGFLIRPVYAAEIIRLFGPNTIVRKRARVVPGNASYLKGKAGAQVGYVGENQQGPVTDVKFGMIDMTEKDISAILPISKKLLRNANALGVESYCRDELVRAAAEFEDRKALYGTGTGKEVKGYASSIPAAMKFDAGASATPTNQQVRALLRKILAAIANANVPLNGSGAAWFMHPAVKMYLEDLYQADVKAFPTLEGDSPTLMGYPVDTSTQITGPAGTGGEIFFGAHQYAMLGDSVAMSLSVSDQATFIGPDGVPVNMWAQGMMAIKLDMSHDFALQYEQAFGMLTGVKWGQ